MLWILQQFDLQELIAAIRSAHLWPLIPVFLLILAAFFIRAHRWRLLLAKNPEMGIWNPFRALMVGYL